MLQLAGMEMLEGALFLIILGAYILIKPWFDKRQLFWGKIQVAIIKMLEIRHFRITKSARTKMV